MVVRRSKPPQGGGAPADHGPFLGPGPAFDLRLALSPFAEGWKFLDEYEGDGWIEAGGSARTSSEALGVTPRQVRRSPGIQRAPGEAIGTNGSILN